MGSSSCLVVILSIFLMLWRFTISKSYGRLLIEVHRDFPSAKMSILTLTRALLPGLQTLLTFQTLIIIRLLNYPQAVLIGASLYSIGTVLSSVAPNEYTMLVSYGIICGIGGSLIAKIPVFILSEIFPLKHKFHIVGTSMISLCAPIGGLLIPIADRLFIAFGWRIVFLISGCTLFVFYCIFAYIIGNVDISEKKTINDKDISTEVTTNIPSSDSDSISLISMTRNNPADVTAVSDVTMETKMDAVKDTMVENTTSEVKEQKTNEALPNKDSTRLKVKIAIVATFVMNIARSMISKLPAFILIKYSNDMGYKVSKSTNLVVYLCLAKLVSRWGIAFIGDRFLKGRLLYVYAISYFLLAIASGSIGLTANTFDQLVIYSILTGFLSSPLCVGQYAICAEVHDGKWVRELYALNSAARAVGMMTSLILTGALYDITGTFKFTFALELVAQSIGFVCACTIILVNFIK